MPNYRTLRTLEDRPITDSRYRPGDRHKSRPGHHGKSPNKWDRRLIVAWDGEGANLDTGEHVYNLLANSDGSWISNDLGISTLAAFKFMFDNSQKHAINVIYGGSYDVNMILRDLSRDDIEKLWNTGHCYYKNYKILYSQRKKLTLWQYYEEGRKLKYRTFILWDVLGYFQASFVIACRKWLGELPILDEIEDMKLKRSSFTTDSIEQITDYCLKECGLLVKLMENLFDAMDEGGIRLTRFDGAGSIASALLRKYKTTEHRGKPSDEAKRWAQFAYSGGWIEAPKVGTTENQTIYRDDINSAYPSSALSLPSYTNASWTVEKEWNGTPHSLIHVKWHFKDAPFYPLFFREPDGSILHPKSGEGIYFGVEIENLVKYHPGEYEIIQALNVRLSNDVKPFAFLEEVYALRMMYKSVGNMAAEALKLGMNSIYGKLAQKAGYRNGRIPIYHHLLWAGEITARTRAKLYAVSRQHMDTVIAFATDAIISTKPFRLAHGTKLGEWTPEKFKGITIIQPGVYFLSGQQDWVDKYRGFDKGSLLREDIIECWKTNSDYEATLTRFVTMGSALGRIDFRKHWRTWAVEPRKLDILPSGKRMAGEDTCYWLRLCDTIAVPNPHVEAISSPHSLPWVSGDQIERPKVSMDDGESVDIRVLEQEYLDAYA